MAKIKPPSLHPCLPPMDVMATQLRPSTSNQAFELRPRTSSTTTRSTPQRSRTGREARASARI
eukprot:8937230-Heterocapsa_arctica.AAC.1